MDCSVNMQVSRKSPQNELVMKATIKNQRRLQRGEGLSGLQREHAGEQEVHSRCLQRCRQDKPSVLYAYAPSPLVLKYHMLLF
jgi:ABC-type proline/glycine betaine transport system substrate-binding protein